MKKIIILLVLIYPLISIAQWEAVNSPIEFGGRVLHEFDGRLFYSGLWDGPLYHSNDYGITWVQSIPELTEDNPILSVKKTNNYLYASGTLALYRSEDNGDTWLDIGSGYPDNSTPSDIVGLEKHNNNIYAAMTGVNVAKSNDQGLTWENITENFNCVNDGCPFIYDLISTPDGIFASGWYGIWRSQNDGDSWENMLDNGEHLINDIAYDESAEIYYAISNTNGVLKSVNNGTTWQQIHSISDGKSIFVDTYSRIYIGGGEEFEYSDDFGETWTSLYSEEIGLYIMQINIIDNYIWITSFMDGISSILKHPEPSYGLQANFEASNTNPCEDDEIQFFNNSTGDIESYQWIFEGGIPNTSNEENPVVSYSLAGTYDVSLTVINSTEQHSITMENYIEVQVCGNNLMADFEASNTDPCDNDEIQFVNMSEGNPTTFLWNFDGGTPETSTEENPVVSYSEYGSYTVSLTIANDNNESTTSITDYITVHNCSGIELLTSNNMNIFPNPGNGYYEIVLPILEDYSIQLIDIKGRIVYEAIFNSNYYKMDISHLDKGVYILKANNSSKHNLIKKIIHN